MRRKCDPRIHFHSFDEAKVRALCHASTTGWPCVRHKTKLRLVVVQDQSLMSRDCFGTLSHTKVKLIAEAFKSIDCHYNPLYGRNHHLDCV